MLDLYLSLTCIQKKNTLQFRETCSFQNDSSKCNGCKGFSQDDMDIFYTFCTYEIVLYCSFMFGDKQVIIPIYAPCDKLHAHKHAQRQRNGPMSCQLLNSAICRESSAWVRQLKKFSLPQASGPVVHGQVWGWRKASVRYLIIWEDSPSSDLHPGLPVSIPMCV